MENMENIVQVPAENHYVMANISIPLKVLPNGKYDVLNEYIDINFEKMQNTPCKKHDINQSTTKLSQLIQQLGCFLTQTEGSVEAPPHGELGTECGGSSTEPSFLKDDSKDSSTIHTLGNRLFVQPDEIVTRMSPKNTSFRHVNLRSSRFSQKRRDS